MRQSKNIVKIEERIIYGICNIEQWNQNAIFAYDAYQIKGEECKRCVLDAIHIGYRLIDRYKI